jgi:hypothetical protein
VTSANGPTEIETLLEALTHLELAIALLDTTAAPANIAAHVDLASCQLREAIGRDPGLQAVHEMPQASTIQ